MSLQVQRVGNHLIVTWSGPTNDEWPDNTVSGSNFFKLLFINNQKDYNL